MGGGGVAQTLTHTDTNGHTRADPNPLDMQSFPHLGPIPNNSCPPTPQRRKCQSSRKWSSDSVGHPLCGAGERLGGGWRASLTAGRWKGVMAALSPFGVRPLCAALLSWSP